MSGASESQATAHSRSSTRDGSSGAASKLLATATKRSRSGISALLCDAAPAINNVASAIVGARRVRCMVPPIAMVKLSRQRSRPRKIDRKRISSTSSEGGLGPLRIQAGQEFALNPLSCFGRAETAGVQVENPIVVDRERGKRSQVLCLSAICGLQPRASLLAGDSLAKLFFATREADDEQACSPSLDDPQNLTRYDPVYRMAARVRDRMGEDIVAASRPEERDRLQDR